MIGHISSNSLLSVNNKVHLLSAKYKVHLLIFLAECI